MELTARQAELADAALAVIARDGLGALSFRALAAAAGCSVGAVQKAFPAKTAMLAAAFERLRARAVPLPEGGPGRPTMRAWTVELLIRFLPLDAERAEAHRLGAAFGQLAGRDAEIATALAESDARIEGLLASLVARARAEGEIDPPADPATTAWAILALAQGTASQLESRPLPEADVRARLDAAVGALLG